MSPTKVTPLGNMSHQGQRKYEELLAEHEALYASISDLRAFLDLPRAPAGEEGCETWACTLVAKLINLHQQVARHFRHEELSGFLDWLESEFPRSAHAVDVLRSDHDRILFDLRTVLGAALIYEEGKQPPTVHLRSWTNAILEALLQHEREETELVQRLHYQDLGVGD